WPRGPTSVCSMYAAPPIRRTPSAMPARHVHGVVGAAGGVGTAARSTVTVVRSWIAEGSAVGGGSGFMRCLSSGVQRGAGFPACRRAGRLESLPHVRCDSGRRITRPVPARGAGAAAPRQRASRHFEQDHGLAQAVFAAVVDLGKAVARPHLLAAV